MSQTQQTPPAKKSLNNPSIITYFHLGDGTIIIVFIVLSDGKTHVFRNGIGTIVPMNRITWKKESQTSVENQKQYTIRFEDVVWKVYFGETPVHTFDEIFGLPDGITLLKNVSFLQFKYVPTADDERTEQFRQLLGQLVSAYPDQFCLEDSKKKMEVCVGGKKVRIPQSIFDLIKKRLISLGVSRCFFVEHLLNGSENGVCRGDMDFYVLNAKQKDFIIDILTELGFVKDSTDKSNDYTFRIYCHVLCQKISEEAIMSEFNLPEGSDQSQYYIEVEIKIATEFQKAYESNCLGYFLGLLLSHFLKISISGVSLKHGCGEIPLNVASFDDFLKKLGINLDGIRTTEKFIEKLLASPLISELLTVDDILRLYKNIMGDEKMKHTSKPLREWLHLILCGLKERFPDRFPSLRSELVQEMVRDEKNSQMIPVWRVRLFVLNQGSENEIQMEKGVLSISVSEKKLFVSTGADEMSLIFFEKQLKSDSGKQALPESMKVCSRLFELLKDYFDHLKDINSKKPIVEQLIDALGCRSEVETHLREVGSKLMKKICEELMKALYPVNRMKPASMSGSVYGELIKNLNAVVINFSQFEEFCVERDGLTGDYKSFVIQMMNHQIFRYYYSRTDALSRELSLEEHTQKRGEIYADAMRNIENLCLELVKKWTRFHNSSVNWEEKGNKVFHIPSQTSHETTSDWRPYYLGTSVLKEEVPSDSLPSKGKKTQKGKSEGTPVPEEKPHGEPVHVFMNGQSGEIFTVPIAE